MPFTFSHAAFVLPFKKIANKAISMTGLIVGSMSPDLEYFSRMRIFATIGHDWIASLYFNVPMALIYCFLFHLFVRNILIDHLPVFLQTRFVKFKNFNWLQYFKNNFSIVIFSLIIGMYSHLIWDSFTHEWGFFVKQINLLNQVWIPIGSGIKGYKFLQHFSSIIGLIYIMYWIMKLPKSNLELKIFEINFWIKIGLSTLIISFIRFYFFPIDIMTGNIIVVPIMAGFLSLILFGILEIVHNKKA